MVAESWKDVKENPNYMVSNTGRIKSKARTAIRKNGTPMPVREREVFGGRTLGGYRSVSMYDSGTEIRRTVHSLVAAAFIGPRPSGYTINHKDGNKENNCAENLEYVTQLDNIHHAIRTGLSRLGGEGHQNSRFTEKQVRKGYDLVLSGHTYKKAAELSGMTETALRGVCSRKNWKLLDLPRIPRRVGNGG